MPVSGAMSRTSGSRVEAAGAGPRDSVTRCPPRASSAVCFRALVQGPPGALKESVFPNTFQ